MLWMCCRAATYCTFGLRESISVLTYTRCSATSATCRIREKRNPTAAASHFTPSRRTCCQPPQRNVRWRLREETTEEELTRATPFPGPSGPGANLPSPVSLDKTRTVRLWAAWRAFVGAETRGSAPRCAIKDARRTPVPPTKDGTSREF